MITIINRKELLVTMDMKKQAVCREDGHKYKTEVLGVRRENNQ